MYKTPYNGAWFGLAETGEAAQAGSGPEKVGIIRIMNPGTSFGLWLKARRRSMDLTQPDLAKRVGCSLETIVKIESGERRPSKQVAELDEERRRLLLSQREQWLQFIALND